MLTYEMVRSFFVSAAEKAAQQSLQQLNEIKTAAKEQRIAELNGWVDSISVEMDQAIQLATQAAEEAARIEGIREADLEFCQLNGMPTPEELAAKAALEEARTSITSLLRKVAKLLAKESKYSSVKSQQVAKALKKDADRLSHAFADNNGWQPLLAGVNGQYSKLASLVEDNKTQEEARQKAHANAIRRKATLVRKEDRKTSAPPQPTKKAPKPEPLARPTKPVVVYEDPIDEGGLTQMGAELAAIADKLADLV